MAASNFEKNNSNRFEIDRLNALSDGVIAIALTLLVLGIDIPENHDFNAEGLKNFLIKLEPSLVAYVSSFLIIAIYWIQHHKIYQVLKYSNSTVVLLNILFLFAITLLPFVSKMKALYRYDALVILLFALAHIFTGMVLYGTWKYIVKHSEQLQANIDPKIITNLSMRLLIAPVICTLAIAVGFFDVNIATYFFLLIPVVFIFFPKK